MFLMYADEADQDGQREFLVYAAVFFPSDRVLEVCKGISELRLKYGFTASDPLKFSTGTKPESVSREDHTSIKSDVLKLAAKLGCKTCCYVIPHAIARGQPHENRLKYGVNTLLIKFDQFLRESGNLPGTATFDRTEDYPQAAHLREISESGVNLENGSKRNLEYVVSLGTTQNGMSHLNSVTDIVVGSFRWVINEPDKDKVGAKLLAQLSNLLWGAINDKGELVVQERGLVIRPKVIRSQKYKADIDAFIERLKRYQKGYLNPSDRET